MNKQRCVKCHRSRKTKKGLCASCRPREDYSNKVKK